MIIRALTTASAFVLLTACGSTDPAMPAADTPEAWLSGVNLSAYMDCAREQNVTLLQAHRAGDRPGAAENSIGASYASFVDGAVFSELDVARSSDGVLVLMHDRTVDRTTTGTGTVTDMTYAEIAALNLVDVDGNTLDEVAPTLEEILDALDGVGIAQIDLKDIDMPTIAAEIVANDAAHRSIVITYTIDDAIALHTALPEVMMSVGIRSLDDVATLEAAGVDLTRVQAWLGLGSGNPELDAALAERGIETSYGDFRAESNGTIDYTVMAENGAEVISVDDVPGAAAALDSAAQARAVLDNCPAARS